MRSIRPRQRRRTPVRIPSGSAGPREARALHDLRDASARGGDVIGARRRRGAALALALALHAGVGLLLMRASLQPRPPPPKTQPVVITIVEPKSVWPLVTPPKAPHPTDTKVSTRTREPHPPAAPSPAPPSPLPPGPPEPAPAQPPINAPVVTQTPTPPSPSGPVNLFIGQGLQATVDNWKAGLPKPPGGGGGGEPEADPDSPIAEHARVLGRITHDVTEYVAHDRVDSGLVDPYFTGLAKNMRESWKPHPNMVGGSEGKGALGDLENFARSWHAAAKKYGANGNPLADDAAPTAAPTHEFQRDPVGGSGFDSADFAARMNNGDMGGLVGLVVLQLTQNAKGEATDVRVLQSSGSAALDASATAEIKRVAGESPPPAHGLGLGGPSIRTVWKMEARMVTNGIIPSATFDPSLGSASVQAPMQTRMVTRVELVAIYGGETGSHPTAPE